MAKDWLRWLSFSNEPVKTCMQMNTSKLLLFALLPFAAARIVAEPIEMWLSSPSDLRYYGNMLRLYQKTVDEDFEAEFRFYGFRELPDKLAVAIKTNTNPPDIVQLDENFFGMYLRGETPFLDLTDRVVESGLKEDILASRLSLFSKGDQIFGLPQSTGATVLYYRRDLLEQYGLGPADFETWEDVERLMGPLAANGQGFLAIDPSLFEILLRQRGSHLLGPNGEPLPDFELAVETLEWMAGIVESGVGVVPDRSTVFDPAFFTTDVANNEVMAIVGADWYGLDMIQNFSQDLSGKWGIMPMPAWNEVKQGAKPIRVSVFAGQGLLIYKDSKRVDDAWDFISFVMTNREANVERFVGGNSFPAYKPVFDDPRLLAPQTFFGGDSLGRIIVDHADDLPRVAMSAKRPQAVFMIREGLISSVLQGQTSARAALEELRDRLAE